MRLSVASAAREAADAVALIDGQRILTWGDVADRVASLPAPSPGLRQLTPSIDATSALSILAGLGGETSMVLWHPRRRAASRPPAPEVAPGSIALESSGTSSTPKLIVHRREALLAHADASAAVLGSEPDDRWLVCLPLAHVSGLGPLVRALAFRRAIILEPRFSVDRLIASVNDNRATVVSLVPTMLDDLVSAGWRPPAHLRHVLVGGALVAPRLLDRARELGIGVRVAYGMTETFSHVALDGRPLPGVETRLGDGGVLEIRAPMTTAWPGWLRTGDLAHIAGDGRIDILGRADELIISGGENVAPAAVEQALRELEGISDAAVVGLDDDHWGQLVAAAVVAPPDLDLAALDRALRQRLASFEIPRRLIVVTALPRLASGKLDRQALLRQFE